MNFKCCRLIFVSIFSFILGCMISINLAPIDKTCKLEDKDKEYNVMNNSKLKNPDLIVFILSALTNVDKRNTLRETWLTFKERIDDENVKFKMKHYFLIGSFGLKNEEIATLQSEQIKHNDILLLPHYDHYNNLTEKVLKAFIWLNDQLDVGLDFKYVLKCDDDSFVRINDLAHELMHLEIIYLKSSMQDLRNINDNSSPYLRVNIQSNKETLNLNRELYWGYFKGNATIKTKGKWKESDWMICDRYLPYAQGGGYVLSKNLVLYLARNANYLRYYHSEDVSVGTWLAPINNILRIHDKRFDTEWITRGCQNYYLISHKLNVNEMQSMYKNIINTGNLCKKEIIKRPHYLYNWLLPPSKCCSKA